MSRIKQSFRIRRSIERGDPQTTASEKQASIEQEYRLAAITKRQAELEQIERVNAHKELNMTKNQYKALTYLMLTVTGIVVSLQIKHTGLFLFVAFFTVVAWLRYWSYSYDVEIEFDTEILKGEKP